MASLLLSLLSPLVPLWIKIGVAVLLIGAVIAWWTQDYWHDLHTPAETPQGPRARPPF